MNFKHLLAVFLILAILAPAVQTLTIKAPRSHKAVKIHAKQFTAGLNHMVSSVFHLGAYDGGSFNVQPELPSGPLTIIPPKESFVDDFTSFALKDDDLFASIVNGTPLSAEAEKRVKDFIKGNDNFHKEMESIFLDPSRPCMNDISAEQRRTILNIIVDNMNIQGILDDKGEGSDGVTDESIGKIEDGIRNEPSLGESVLKCYQQSEDAVDEAV